MNIIAIIPVRAGSTRVKNKNSRDFLGKPLMAWAIESALESGVFDRVLVSTEDEKLAQIAREYGAETPFVRPNELAGDKVGFEPVLKDAIEWLRENEGYKVDAVALLPVTQPLRKPADLVGAVNTYVENEATHDCVVTVNPLKGNDHPYWILEQSNNESVKLANGKPVNEIITRSQDLPPIYFYRNDVAYICRAQNLLEEKPTLYGKEGNIKLYVIDDDDYKVDINTEWDWKLAEYIVRGA